MTLKKGSEIATIDVNMVTISTGTSGTEIALTTANKIAVEPQIETTEAVKLIVKGVLLAQKPSVETVTGNEITLTDNVFNAEILKILQGGTITYDSDSTTITGYTPPKASDTDKGSKFTLTVYTAQYNAAGTIVQYEKCEFPSCVGKPISPTAEDGVFRVMEYTIISMPDSNEAPYKITYVDDLPTVS